MSLWHVTAAVRCECPGPSWSDKQKHAANATLELRRIPADMNNITKINEHFTKFGTLVNLQVRLVLLSVGVLLLQSLQLLFMMYCIKTVES